MVMPKRWFTFTSSINSLNLHELWEVKACITSSLLWNMENMCDAFRETLRVIIIRILEWMQALLMLMRRHGGQTFTDSTGSLLLWDVGPEQQRFNVTKENNCWSWTVMVKRWNGRQTFFRRSLQCRRPARQVYDVQTRRCEWQDRFKNTRTDLHSWFLLQYRKEMIAEKLASGSSHFAN